MRRHISHGRNQHTNSVHGGQAIAEPSAGAAGEIDAVGRVVRHRQRRHVVVVAIVDEGVSEDEVAWDLRRWPN